MKNRLRYLYSTLRYSNSYLNSFNEYFLQYYLRHNKIIGWYKSKPVYSAFLTPGLSKPLANTLSRRLMSNLLQKPLPGMINFALTDVCNARCEHCSFFNNFDEKERKDMTLDEVKLVIKKCQDFGISIINFVGGEPLLRNDIGKIISSVDKSKSSSALYTNGWLLKQKAKELKKSGLMMVIVSLDSDNPKKHDEFRRMPNLFFRAISGIKEAQKQGLLTAISTTLTQEDLENGNFERMIKLAKKLKVNELIVFDTMPIGMYSHRIDLMKTRIDKKRLFYLVDKYNSKQDYPGIFCYAHFRDNATFGCSAGRNYFYISPYGDMHPCDFTSKPVGNLLEHPLPDLWFKLVNIKSQAGSFMNSCCETQTFNLTLKGFN